MIEKIIYTVPDVGSITFGATAPFYCLSFDGTSVSSRPVTNTAIGVHGQITSDITLSARTIPCCFAIMALNDSQTAYDFTRLRQLQQEVTRLMNPLNTGTLIRVNKYGTYSITARPSETPKFEKVAGATCKFSVDFVADSPLWRSTRPKVFELPTEGTFSFHNKSGMILPFVLSGSIRANTAIRIENLTTGQAMQPRFSKEFDWDFSVDTETCEVLAQKESGGKLVSANHIFTYDSDLDMVLVPGENIFEYEATGDSSTTSGLTITAFDRFVGVG